ncbi:hypothetical protein [Mycolicibacterium gilvum]|uniref:hypothetical protein n=1 Tax=Mycolicibacterium gilvum TaxID=1804 RepID=UPI0040458499
MMITETACAVPFFANIDLSPNHPLRCDTKAIVRRAVSGDIFSIDCHNLVIASFGRAFSATSPAGLVWPRCLRRSHYFSFSPSDFDLDLYVFRAREGSKLSRNGMDARSAQPTGLHDRKARREAKSW